MKKILSAIGAGIVVLLLFYDLLRLGIRGRGQSPDGSTAQNAIKVVYGPDSNGPSHFWPDKRFGESLSCLLEREAFLELGRGEKNGSALFSGNDLPEQIQGVLTGGEKTR